MAHPCGCDKTGRMRKLLEAKRALRPKEAQPVVAPSSGGMSLYTTSMRPIILRDWYRGQACFLLCNGPSLAAMDLTMLRLPGIMTMGMNNGWAIFRPDLWICVDRPGSFIDTGWKDPRITKFVPTEALRSKLHVKKQDGTFKKSAFAVSDMPAVFCYMRNNRFDPETFLHEDSVNWGCGEVITDSLGIRGGRSVMLASLRILCYLGFTRVYIVGADFKMAWQPDGQGNYAFKQWRWKSSVTGNNASYEALNRRFEALQPKLLEEGIKVFNCTPGSGLSAFPPMDYEEAVADASRECRKKVDTENWYNHILPGDGKADDALSEQQAWAGQGVAGYPHPPSAGGVRPAGAVDEEADSSAG